MAAANPLRYRGYYFDSESGFYYLQSRYYDPEISRFINADDFASTGQGILGYNMFAYCGNNPVMGYDPTGHWDWGGVITGLGIIAITTAIVATCGIATVAGALVAGAAITTGAVTTYAAATDSVMVAETGFYYLQSRYYDPKISRFINADDFASTGQGILGHNMFAYCGNNPIVFRDSSGYSVETALDIASALYSLFNLIGSPSWANAGYLLWDAASVIIPVLPGSYVATGGKVLFRVAGKLDEFVDSAEVLTGTYRQLKKLLKGTKNIEIHHLIEKRFAGLFSSKPGEFLSIALSPETHQQITNRWRNLHKVDDIFKNFAYGSDYSVITYDQMVKAVKEVYHDMPAVLDNVLEWLSENWKG